MITDVSLGMILIIRAYLSFVYIVLELQQISRSLKVEVNLALLVGTHMYGSIALIFQIQNIVHEPGSSYKLEGLFFYQGIAEKMLSCDQIKKLASVKSVIR